MQKEKLVLFFLDIYLFNYNSLNVYRDTAMVLLYKMKYSERLNREEKKNLK